MMASNCNRTRAAVGYIPLVAGGAGAGWAILQQGRLVLGRLLWHSLGQQ